MTNLVSILLPYMHFKAIQMTGCANLTLLSLKLRNSDDSVYIYPLLDGTKIHLHFYCIDFFLNLKMTHFGPSKWGKNDTHLRTEGIYNNQRKNILFTIFSYKQFIIIIYKSMEKNNFEYVPKNVWFYYCDLKKFSLTVLFSMVSDVPLIYSWKQTKIIRVPGKH